LTANIHSRYVKDSE